MSAASTATDHVRIGTTIAKKYRVLRLLGAGGMGSVFEAEHMSLGKRVALKFLHMEAQRDQTTVARFQQEARAICAVSSDHIVNVFDWGQDNDGHPYLVLELLEGRDLAEKIQSNGALPIAETIRFSVEALRGLKRVHDAGIVHRDLKPENLFLVTGDDGLQHVKIVDFGLSKLMDREDESPSFESTSRLTHEGAVIGTPLYMSPEQVDGIDALDYRTDLWSMGAIIFEMLTGQPPFVNRSYARLVMAICHQDPPDLRQLSPEIPEGLVTAVLGALTRDRAKRFQSAAELLSAITRVQEDLRPRTVLSVAPPTPTQPSAGSTGASRSIGGSDADPLDATIASNTKGAATVWLTDAPVYSVWRGAVDSFDKLRVEGRDGLVRDLELRAPGPLKLGRARGAGGEVNDIVYPDMASRLAATMHHDGMRWWITRRVECSVPVKVAGADLERGDKMPLYHGVSLSIGAMHAAFVDRRYVSRTVAAGTVDPVSGLLAQVGLEQEVATALQRDADFGLVLAFFRTPVEGRGAVEAAAAVHKSFDQAVVARVDQTVACLLEGDADALAQNAATVVRACQESGAPALAVGYWKLEGAAANAGREVELSFNALETSAANHQDADGVTDLRRIKQAFRVSQAVDVLDQAQSAKRQLILFGIEEQGALRAIGPKVIGALEHELAAMIGTQVGPNASIAALAPGVIGACVPRKVDPEQVAVSLQCEWHARPPVTDGKIELARSLTWEVANTDQPERRALELAGECSDSHGALSALSGGLPYPIAGRVRAVIGASSAVERVKMLFDVLEGTWRFIALVIAAAYFSRRSADQEDQTAMLAFLAKTKTRHGYPLGTWRELARIASLSFDKDDPIGKLAGELLHVRLTKNQTFEALSNLMHSERNSFAHGLYNEARAAADLNEFEQMTRTFLRALRPLASWTLVSVQRTEPDLYNESQTVEFIDHTGPHLGGARRRIGFASSIRLANVAYLVRWRDGLVLPLAPFVRRLAHEDRYDLFWVDHLPRPGPCRLSGVVNGETVDVNLDGRRLPPLLRTMTTTSGS